MPEGAVVKEILKTFMKTKLIKTRLPAHVHSPHRQDRPVQDQRQEIIPSTGTASSRRSRCF